MSDPINLAGDRFDTLACEILDKAGLKLPGHEAANLCDAISAGLRQEHRAGLETGTTAWGLVELQDDTVDAYQSGHSRGFGAGLEAAAQWHEEQGKDLLRSSTQFDNPTSSVLDQVANYHLDFACRIRALPITGETRDG